MGLVSLICYLACLVTIVVGLGDNFYTLTNLTSWDEANRTCTLATPKINYTRYRLILDFGDDIVGVVGEHWVGYTTHNLILQYIGCSHEADVAAGSTGNFTLPYASPGFCYSACDTGVFGVRASQCYCIETRSIDVDGKQTCNRACSRPGTKCGGESAVSIFEVADITMSNFTSDPTADDYCIAYEPSKHAFTWEECYRTLRAQMCQTSSEHQLMTFDDRKTWSESADVCFSRRSTNIIPDVNDAVDKIGPYWTGYFRTDEVIRTFKDPGTPVQYGHVNIQDQNGQPEIRIGSGQTDFDAICFEKQDATTTTIQSTPSTPERSHSHVSTTTGMESNASTQESKKEYLLVKIGVPLLILACVVVAVVAGIICYRRRRSHKPSTQAPNIVEHYSQVQDPYDDAQNVYNEPFDKVIERKTNTSEHGHENRSMPNDEDEYDTTGTLGNIATERGVDDNVYNKLELVTDDTYDHANGPKGQRNAQADKPGPSNVKAGHGVVTENTYDREDTEEGSYSHVNAGIIKQETTDNVYN